MARPSERDKVNGSALQGRQEEILGGHLLGWRTVCAVEWADYLGWYCRPTGRRDPTMIPNLDDTDDFDGKP